MRSLRSVFVVMALLAQTCVALAAGPGAPGSRKLRLGTFEGARVENSTLAGRKEPTQTVYPTTTFVARKGRLYVTLRPSNQLKKANPWRQSFKIVSDVTTAGERVIRYRRDDHPVVRRNNERAIEATYGGAARLRGMSGSGHVVIANDQAQWTNVGDGEMMILHGNAEIGARYDWSESFMGLRGTPSARKASTSPPPVEQGVFGPSPGKAAQASAP